MFPSDPEPVPSPRLMLFSHDTYGLGHLRRSTAIARECSARIPDASILYVTGSLLPSCFEIPERCDIVKLPVLTKDSGGRYVPGALDVTVDLAVSLRRGLAFEAVRRFDPHLVLIDHAPLGAARELRPALEWLRSHRPGTRVVLGMRDVIDAPSRVQREFGSDSLADLIRRYFDEVLVYGDRRIFDPITEYELPSDVASKLRFIGYVASVTETDDAPADSRLRVVVSSGGGRDGLYVHERMLDALEGPLADFDATIEMTLGPLADQVERERVLDRARRDPRVDARVFRSELSRSFRRADVVVAMAGANTVAEILAADRPAVLLPRPRPRLEQTVRARRLEELGLARVVDVEAPDMVLHLAEAVRRSIVARPPTPLRLRPRTDGARVVADHIRHRLSGVFDAVSGDRTNPMTA